ncbi:MAG: FecR domain-containing protein [Paenibacillus sp.]|nr:FecR domain-containing protein [Paenibacillus sp.]
MYYDQRITRLIYRDLIGTITPAEREMLDRWLEESADHRRFYDSISDSGMLHEEMLSRSVIDYERPARDMLRLIASRRRARTARIVMRAAAILAIVVAAGAAWHFTSTSSLSTASTDSPAIAASHRVITIDDIVAGKSLAIISDSSGKTVALSAEESGTETAAALATPTVSEPRELCLEVPRGGEFKVILEDSTEVWLNSESTIRYPETFSAGERRVAVTGEAYFHVSKDADRPFYVETDRQVIRVYGTSFNVRAYPDEEATFTTLESGSVSLRRNTSLSGEVFLATGHQAILDHKAGQLKMAVVDPETVTSWRHGRFVFDDQPLERIMKDLSRWYDFRYEFSDDSLRSRVFMGSIHRYADFRTAIQILENCGGISFSVTPDNTILISPV